MTDPGGEWRVVHGDDGRAVRLLLERPLEPRQLVLREITACFIVDERVEANESECTDVGHEVARWPLAQFPMIGEHLPHGLTAVMVARHEVQRYSGGNNRSEQHLEVLVLIDPALVDEVTGDEHGVWPHRELTNGLHGSAEER